MPDVGVDVSRTAAQRGVRRRHVLRLVEPSSPDRRHDVDGADHEPDGEVVGLGQQGSQFGEMADGVRLAGQQQVDGQPEQPRQKVGAPPGAGTEPDELEGQRTAQPAVVGAEEAVMCQVQGLGVRFHVPAVPGFAEHGEDRVVLPRPVVDFSSKPHPQPQGGSGARIDRVQCPAQSLHQRGGGDRGALFLNPEPCQAQCALGSCRVVIREFRDTTLGLGAPPASRAQVPLLVQSFPGLREQMPGRR